jgi:hypothetical protein
MGTFIPTKYQSPLIIDSDAMKTSQITLQCFGLQIFVKHFSIVGTDFLCTEIGPNSGCQILIQQPQIRRMPPNLCSLVGADSIAPIQSLGGDKQTCVSSEINHLLISIVHMWLNSHKDV